MSKVDEVKKYLESGVFGCHTEQVTKLMEMVLGEKLSKPKKTVEDLKNGDSFYSGVYRYTNLIKVDGKNSEGGTVLYSGSTELFNNVIRNKFAIALDSDGHPTILELTKEIQND